MIDITQFWPPVDLDERGYCPQVDCHVEDDYDPASGLLDADGNPIRRPRQRPPFGFDLRPRKSPR